MKLAFTLCSNNYLAQAKALVDSFIYHNPDYTFIIGLVDRVNPEIDYSFFLPAKMIEVTEVGIEEVGALIEKYNIIEFNTAVKPFFFEYLFKTYNPNHIVYLDPDIAIYSRFNEIDTLFESYTFLLTPHLLTINPKNEPEKERLILNVGIYNLGFLGLKNDGDSLLMLEWWKDRMRNYCYIDFCNGLFVDQIWANYIPSYFNNYHILRSFGYNVGYWNFNERQVTVVDNDYHINADDKLIFFHFSNFDPLRPDKLCKWLSYSFEQRPDLLKLYEDYSRDLINNQYSKLSKLQPMLKFKPIIREEDHSSMQKLGSKLKRFNNRMINKIFDV